MEIDKMLTIPITVTQEKVNELSTTVVTLAQIKRNTDYMDKGTSQDATTNPEGIRDQKMVAEYQMQVKKTKPNDMIYSVNMWLAEDFNEAHRLATTGQQWKEADEANKEKYEVRALSCPRHCHQTGCLPPHLSPASSSLALKS